MTVDAPSYSPGFDWDEIVPSTNGNVSTATRKKLCIPPSCVAYARAHKGAWVDIPARVLVINDSAGTAWTSEVRNTGKEELGSGRWDARVYGPVALTADLDDRGQHKGVYLFQIIYLGDALPPLPDLGPQPYRT